jgi:anti-anti-sigma factor
MATKTPFTYEFEYSEVDPSEDLDSRGRKVTTVKCHGSLVAETRDQIEQIFKETPFQGRIIMDLSDVDYVDSAGLGALIRLKLSAVKQGAVSVKYAAMTPRVMQLLKLSNLADWFSN